MPSVGDFGNECLLRITAEQLPVGPGGQRSAQLECKMEFPGHSRTTLCQKQMTTGDSDCPEKVKLAKQIKGLTGDEPAAEGE